MNHGVDNVFTYVVKAGRYRLVEMLIEGGNVQEQIVCAVFKPEGLSGQPRSEWSLFSLIMKELVSKGKVFTILPKKIADWRKKGGQKATRKLHYEASDSEVKTFLCVW